MTGTPMGAGGKLSYLDKQQLTINFQVAVGSYT
jgi:hypothetical protein